MGLVVHIRGDLFTTRRIPGVYVSCDGLALGRIGPAFMAHDPAWWQDYLSRVRLGEVRPGEPYLFRGARPIVTIPVMTDRQAAIEVNYLTKAVIRLLQGQPEIDSLALAFPHTCPGWKAVRPLLEDGEIPAEAYISTDGWKPTSPVR
jgi:hypothetical protein